MDSLRPYRSFVSYIDRSREYYAAQGYSSRTPGPTTTMSLLPRCGNRSPGAVWDW